MALVLNARRISISFHHECITIPFYMPICNSVFSLLGVLFPDEINSGHVRSIYVFANNLVTNVAIAAKKCIVFVLTRQCEFYARYDVLNLHQ